MSPNSRYAAGNSEIFFVQMRKKRPMAEKKSLFMRIFI